MAASLTWSVSGTTEDAVELRERLNELGAVLGYAVRRGPTAGRGGGSNMMRDIAEGGAAVLPALSDGDYAWLALLLQEVAEANPDRVVFIQTAVASLVKADALRQLGPIGKGGGGRIE